MHAHSRRHHVVYLIANARQVITSLWLAQLSAGQRGGDAHRRTHAPLGTVRVTLHSATVALPHHHNGRKKNIKWKKETGFRKGFKLGANGMKSRKTQEKIEWTHASAYWFLFGPSNIQHRSLFSVNFPRKWTTFDLSSRCGHLLFLLLCMNGTVREWHFGSVTCLML